MSTEITEKLDKMQRMQTELLVSQARMEEKINGICGNYIRHENEIEDIKKNMNEMAVKMATISGGIGLLVAIGSKVLG